MFGLPDPTEWHLYWEDFDYYLSTDWTITNASTGTIALTDVDGGCILLTNNSGDDNLIAMQKKGEGFLLAANKQAFFKCRFKVSDATQSDIAIGLQVTDTTPLDVTDGVYFLKTDGAATLDFICRKDASTGSNSDTAIASLADDTFVTLAWYFDGVSTVKYYVNDVLKGDVSGASAYLPDTEMTISFALQNGEAVAKTMTLDYILAAIER